MADARAEQIMAAIEAALAGLATTGDKVQRGQVYPHQADDLPAIGIISGPDVPAAEFQSGIVDWELTVIVEAIAQIGAAYTTPSSTIETTLNQIRKEVHAALMANYTLGLSFVSDIRPGAVAEPLLDRDGNLPIGSLAISDTVNYQSSRADISA